MTLDRSPSRMRWLLAALTVALALTAVGPSALAKPSKDVPHVWVYSGTQNFRHASIPHAKDTLAQWAKSTGAFTVEFTEDPADLTADMLGRTDIALFLSPSGIANDDGTEDAPFSAKQRKLFRRWIACGGGFVGVHQAADSYDDWPEWDELVGAKFEVHQITGGEASAGLVPGGDEATINVNDHKHPATAPWHGKDSFAFTDEWYAWLDDKTPDKMTTDFNQLLGFDSFTNPAVEAFWGSRYDENQALAWTSTFRGRNRSFYTNLGHMDATWDTPEFRTHLLNGLRWVAQVRPGDTCAAGGRS